MAWRLGVEEGVQDGVVADTYCRVEKEAHSEGEMWVRGRRACDVRHKAGCREDSTGEWGQGVGGAHLEHVAHVCDAGGVPARKIFVERTQVFEQLVHAFDS